MNSVGKRLDYLEWQILQNKLSWSSRIERLEKKNKAKKKKIKAVKKEQLQDI